MLFECPWLCYLYSTVTWMWNGKESASEDFGPFDKVGAEIRAYEEEFGC